jgi:uncharacterized tellurite resistance protein B-like protein
MLIGKLKALLSATTQTEEETARGLELACAALMFEVARADFAVDDLERAALTTLLAEEFSLSDQEVLTITEAAAEQADAATCLFEFTRAVNDLASVEQKRSLLGMMWRVAMADDALSRYEEHVIRKVADLLYLPHSDFMLAKREAQ